MRCAGSYCAVPDCTIVVNRSRIQYCINRMNIPIIRSRLKTPVSILSAKKKAQTQARLTL